VQEPFRAAIDSGVEVMMVGPCIVTAYDPERAALRSPTVIGRLRQQFGFSGLVLSDDLDAKATLQGDSIVSTAVDALCAGCNLLLLADIDDQVSAVTDGIVEAVRTGTLPAQTLSASAEGVRALARRYALTDRS